MKKYTFLLFFYLIIQTSFSQKVELSVYSEVSIITVGPGEKLYESFGHSAIRIKDPVLNLDAIYNYGMFDFKAPNFILNFVKGRLLYKVVGYPFKYFIEGYQAEKRWMVEQVLNLTQKEKQQFFLYLQNNVKPKNATYLYDPYFNNCSTKMVDIANTVLKDAIIFSDSHLTEQVSYRQLMNREISWNTWGSFGIDLALGSKLDEIADQRGFTYLPDYALKAFDNASIKKGNQLKKAVKKEHLLLDFKEKKAKISFFNPFLIFSILTLIGLFITYKDYKNSYRSKWLDFSIFFITGALGSLLVFLMFFTNHSTTPKNFNFLWAFAPNLLIAFLLLKEQPKKWIVKYVYFLLILLIVIPVIWISKTQLLPLSILPFLILLFIRYLFLSKNLLTFKK